ncbi:hypothetical protein MKX01_025696 [Papaver californicum]|nr:hypothetical protein MKX01_025696 [Papaver californicum]
MNLLHQVKQETQVELETLQASHQVQKPLLNKGVRLDIKKNVDLGKVDRDETTGCSEENTNKAVTKTNRNGQDFSATTKANTRIYEYPDPEFFDFEIDKREECLAVGQLWAVYDDFDGMPRLYARIEKVGLFVYSLTQKASLPSFKVHITWLDASPDRIDDIVWNKKGLPIACGKFKHRPAGTLTDISVFSHQVNNHRNFDYEYVEVLSDYTEQLGINPKGVSSFYILPSELLRFSHKVPSYETTGMERDDIPEGYFELDPASLPANLVGVSDSVGLTVNAETVHAKTYDPSKSQAEKMAGVPKKRKQPDENNTLSGGNARSGKAYSWLITKCNMKKLREQKLGNPVEQS